MSINNTQKALAVGAAVAAGTYALSSVSQKKKDNAKRFYTARDVGRPVGDQVKEDESGFEFDFVIVGGGTAAMVLANRLTERDDFNVLVIEAGQSGRNVPNSRVPAAFSKLQRSPHDWTYWTTPQPGCADRVMPWTRTKLLGGCSSGNAMMVHFGAPEDYDEWAKLQGEGAGAEEWAYKGFKKYLTKMEGFVSHPDVPCPTEERGDSGPMKTGYFAYFTEVGKAFIASCDAYGIPHVPDVNTSKGTLGVTRTPTYIDKQGRRVSTEIAYLTHQVLARPNLKVVCGAYATKIRFDTSNPDAPRAIGVEFAEKKDGPVYFVGAKKEVIISAGAVNTPHLLLLSGIGPSDELTIHGIQPIHVLPGVGQHLSDHLVFNMSFPARPGYFTGRFLRPKNPWQTLSMMRAVAQWMITGSGPLTTITQECMAYVRVGDGAIGAKVGGAEMEGDSTSAKTAPDVEIMVSPIAWRDHGHKVFEAPEALTISVVLLRPTSTGTVTLKSADPWEKPEIDPGYLATKRDVETLVRAVKLAHELANTEPLKSIIDQNIKHPLLDHDLGTKSDAEIEQVLRCRVETLYHPTCTARMAPLADGGVVDTKLKVYGVTGLRIVDASVQPKIVSGHTAGPTIGIAELASDLIKGEY